MNTTNTQEQTESSSESTAAEAQSERREEHADVSRSEDAGLDERAVRSSEREVSVKEAPGVVATEIYSNSLHHREIAEKYGVSVRVVKWLMKERGIGFARRDMGKPPEDIAKVVEK